MSAWFRNLQIFRLAPGWNYSTEALAEVLRRGLFLPCAASARQSVGWVPPRGVEGELVFSVAHQQLIALGIEQKLLPAAVVRRHAQIKLAAIETAQGYTPGRQQAREVFEAVEAELLPRALTQMRMTHVWIDPLNRWLVVDSASPAQGDRVIEQLKLTLDELPLTRFKTAHAPRTQMTSWLLNGEACWRFSIDRDGELRSVDAERAAVRFSRHNLDSDEVRGHIANGKSVTQLALTWNDSLSFVLTEQLQLKRLAFLDLLKEDAGRQAETADDLFAANFALMCGELAAMLRDLTRALGGEAE